MIQQKRARVHQRPEKRPSLKTRTLSHLPETQRTARVSPGLLLTHRSLLCPSHSPAPSPNPPRPHGTRAPPECPITQAQGYKHYIYPDGSQSHTPHPGLFLTPDLQTTRHMMTRPLGGQYWSRLHTSTKSPWSFLLSHTPSPPGPLGERCFQDLRPRILESLFSFSHTLHLIHQLSDIYFKSNLFPSPPPGSKPSELRQPPPSAPVPTVTSHRPAQEPPTSSLSPEGKPKCSRPQCAGFPLRSTHSSLPAPHCLCSSNPLFYSCKLEMEGIIRK